jgi:hypothetical protein
MTDKASCCRSSVVEHSLGRFASPAGNGRMTTAQIRGNRPARLTAIPSQARSNSGREGVEARRAASNGREPHSPVPPHDEGMVQRTNALAASSGKAGTKVPV